MPRVSRYPAPIARAKTRKEAEAKARKYIKPGHRVIVKTKDGYEVHVKD